MSDLITREISESPWETEHDRSYTSYLLKNNSIYLNNYPLLFSFATVILQFFNFTHAIYHRKRLKYRARAVRIISDCEIINRPGGKVEGCEFLRSIDFDASDSQRTRSRGCRPFVIDRGTAIGIVTFSGDR